MAVIERVEAQLVADAGQFVQGLNRAQAALGQLIPATQRLQTELDKATADFAQGRLTGEQYGVAMVRIQGQLGVAQTAIKAAEQRVELLTASLLEGKITAQQFGVAMDRIRTGLGSVNPAMGGLTTTAGKATVGFKRFENTMTAIAITTLPGMTGATGRAANALTSLGLAFASLGPFILPILLALGAYAVAADRAKKATDSLFESLQVSRDRRARELSAIAGADDLNALRARLADRERIVQAFDARQLQRAQQGLALEEDTPGVAQARLELEALTRRITELNAELVKNRQQIEYNIAGWDAFIARLVAANNQARLARDLAASQGRIATAAAGGIGIRTTALTEALQTVPEQDVKAELDKILYEPLQETSKDLEMIGRNAGQALVTGMMMGIESMEDFWKLALSVFTNSILGILTQGLGIGSPSRLTMKMGQQLGQGLIVGMQATQAAVTAAALDLAPMGALGSVGAQSTRALGDLSLRASLDVTGVMGAPVNPFAAARDAEWQRLFRESALVAKSQGARLA